MKKQHSSDGQSDRAGLFEPITIGNMTLENRTVRSATWMGMADAEGGCTPRLIEIKAALARGGVGLIITGGAMVDAACTFAPGALNCDGDALEPGLAAMAQAVHDQGGRIALQIAHGGLMAPAELTGQQPVGPSPMLTEQGPLGRALTVDEIDEIVEAFGAAAQRAVRTGYDAVQVHGAHGYLLSEFISPWFNHRTDDYGGSLENRARLLLQVVRRVRQETGDAYPILAKINVDDRLPDGFGVSDMLTVCGWLQEAGVDAIELSGGTTMALLQGQPQNSYARVGDTGVYWRDAAVQLKQRVSLPLILVGGIRSRATAEALLSEGVCDCIALCRPLIREPDLVARWRSGAASEAACISCDGCFGPGMAGLGVQCVQLGASQAAGQAN
jgi:2,4-dienoyl-CoA reductase-like NADH-dependent reductase (Old Yellow Enzyme family)